MHMSDVQHCVQLLVVSLTVHKVGILVSVICLTPSHVRQTTHLAPAGITATIWLVYHTS